VGNTVNAHVRITASDIFSAKTEGYVGLTVGGNGVSDHIRAGIRDSVLGPGGTPVLFFWADGTTYFQKNVSIGTVYHVWITHDSANTYSMHWDGTTPVTIVTYNGGSSNQTQMFGADYYAGAFENDFAYVFSGLVSPYNTATMIECASGTGPYNITPPTSPYSTFEVSHGE